MSNSMGVPISVRLNGLEGPINAIPAKNQSNADAKALLPGDRHNCRKTDGDLNLPDEPTTSAVRRQLDGRKPVELA